MKQGFTLIELMIGIMIFAFISMSLSVVYSTANRHFMQNYRNDLYKNRLSLTMKFISTKIASATAIESPAVNNTSNVLAFYSNFVKSDNSLTYPSSGWNRGCRPDSSQNVRWHYFCLSGNRLFYHTGTINGVDVCPSYSNISNWIGGISCGSGGVFLSDYIYVPSNYNAIFSRGSDSEKNIVGVALRVFWYPSNFRGVQRPVDEIRVSYFSVNMPVY
jgi:prepilin-type N-terminal cleavage/methylation domain-containing protein